MNATKVLTIAVPAYNAEQYIKTCLDSMLGVDPRLEVIVVNDGSTDGTEGIVLEYRKAYPEALHLISKENGGHGSGINRAVQEASGRYFKVIDADDWIIQENLTPLLDQLETAEAEVVITGYHTVNMVSGRVIAFPSACKYAGTPITVDQLMEVYEEISSCCSFHGVIYRTEWYRGTEIRLTEKVFYEDQEYSTLPFAHATSILILPLFFYQYLVGNANQSVAFHNQVKRLGDIETVIRNMLAYRKRIGPLSGGREEYFLRKLAIVVVSFFSTALVKNPDRRQGRADAERFYRWLEATEPELLVRTEKKRRMLMLFHRIHFPMQLYQALLDTQVYKRVKKIWTN